MNTLILINALINKEETFKSFEEYFNDGNNYFVYSFEESLPDFQNFNFRNFKMSNLIKMENIKIISDSKYLKINSKNFESGKFVFEKFSDEIMPAFYGYMIDNIAEINIQQVDQFQIPVDKYTLKTRFYKYRKEYMYENIFIKRKVA